ncbi:transporter substrate-binding domain-containing protein [Exilibacterium tricleocarpae]|uniref:Transporter substrate-binding domain-containing protein n=1 Tax=Exilibacterium tricleocarpae TaxID=2591008 RepID=A0A545SQN6_9GAMM|nr:transporter substrate-binding domain-containing protein [Exilibacterium tricleocarpae]TQV67269.1 transporter substrate-binding domain-containing protein [Exilibacterium tricleocarpae]
MTMAALNRLGAKRLLPYLLILPVLSLPAWATEKVLRFGISATHPLLPVARNLFENMYAELGYTISVVNMPHRRSFKTANDGRELDGVLLQVEEVMAGFDNLLRVESTFYEVESFVWSRDAGLKLDVDGWASIRPYRIGIDQQKLFGISRTEGFNRIVAKDPRQSIKLLAGGRVDLIIMTGFEGRYYGRRQSETRLRRLEPALYSTPLYHYLHRRHRELLPHISRQVRTLSDSGEINRIIEHHMAEQAGGR